MSDPKPAPRKRAPRTRTKRAEALIRETTEEDAQAVRPLPNGWAVRLPSGKEAWAPTRKRALELAHHVDANPAPEEKSE